MGKFAFTPQIPDTNIERFMKRYGIVDWRDLVRKANDDIKWYWDAVNEDLRIEWFQKYDKTFDSSAGLPWTKWFINGKCNIVANAIDRHVQVHPEKVAYIFANESGSKKVTYRELDEQVSRLAGALLNAGIRKGDVIAIYLPMIPEAFYALFACSKIGAVHTTIFSGFSAQALHSRLIDSKAKLLISTGSVRRRGKEIDLASQWQQAVKNTNVSRIIDVSSDYNDLVKNAPRADTEVMEAEDPLFILYTSGTTGEPKGTLQVHGGFTLVSAQQSSYLIDMRPDDVLFWYADIGWITGQVWVVYGNTLVGGTALVYDDALDHPSADSWCTLLQDHKVSIFGAAPTAIRLFMKNNIQTSTFDFSSLRILAATGEPMNTEAWHWYFENVGRQRCPIINLSGGTEVGGAILSALPVMSLKPCTVGCPIPGFDAQVLDDSGKQLKEGYLAIKKPWPSMTRGLLNNPDRFIQTYWSKYGNVWYHGDIVLVDTDGLWYMRGRADDIIKVAGHRIGTAEVEAAVSSHPAIAEAMAVGKPDELKGEAILIYAIIKNNYKSNKNLEGEIVKRVEEMIGRFARPEEIRIVSELPKTRTGKLVRRLAKAKVSGENITDQDLTSVENPWSLDQI